MITRLIATLTLVLLIACAIGPRAESFEPARTPGGARATIQLSDVEFRNAELLVVGDSAVLLLTSGGDLVRVYYETIRSIDFAHGPSATLRGRGPRLQQVAAWRAVSRFPQGLTPPQLDELIAHHGNREVEVIR